jgi:outer membrane protein OmpA-like peptidoglycan-associated protein
MKQASALIIAALLLMPPAGWAQPAETEIEGVTAEVIELRLADGALRLAVRFSNDGTETADFSRNEASRITLIDAKSRTKHLPAKDPDGQWLAGPIGDDIGGGRIVLKIPPKQSTVLWAYFGPVPANTVMTVTVPQVLPFENVTVTEGRSRAFSNTAATTTPGGGRATVVSARRADQTLNLRVRLTTERGAEVDLLDSYFRYKRVYLLDPINKRKYPLMRESSGDFAGQPNTVPGDGGSFVYDWRKASTLINLTFPAPPDSVQRIDLLLPQFAPIEGLAIEGLGGAAAGGVETAGSNLGLEGALKDLAARVTDAEIRIDLAADVLFDFDKAEIRKEAEPSLQKLATVIRATPGATVDIDGHTDARGADAYNQKLSEARAASVKQWLVANAKVDGASIATRGLGRMRPVAPNAKPDGTDDPQGRARNRRVEIVVRKGA